MPDPHVPAACTLEPGDRVERVVEFARLLARVLAGREENERGLRLRLTAAPGVEAELRHLTARESACCGFLEFEVRPAGGELEAGRELELEVRAPAEARPLVDALFRPLAGRRVVVTRPPAQAAELVSALRRLGAEPDVRSAIEVRALERGSVRDALDDALRRLPTYDWVVFTSRNGVRHVWERFEALGGGLERALEYGEEGRSRGPRTAAIGPGTAATLESRGVRPDYVPLEYVAEALAEGLPGAWGARVLLLRADIARPALRDLLRARGAEVDDVAAYRTVPAGAPAGASDSSAAGAPARAGDSTGTGDAARPAADPEGGRAGSGRIDALTFTSPSTVRGFLRGQGGVPEGAAVVCIGPITARAAREAGLRVDAVAASYTVPGLVEALVRHFAAGAGGAAGAAPGASGIPEEVSRS